MLNLLFFWRCSQDHATAATKGTSLIDFSFIGRKRSVIRKDFKALHSSSAEILHRYAKCVLPRRPHQCQVSIVVKHQTISTIPAGTPCVWSVSFLLFRYDIKGCEVSRWTDPAPAGSQIIVVLKDLNFEGQYIDLGKKRAGHVSFLLGTGLIAAKKSRTWHSKWVFFLLHADRQRPWLLRQVEIDTNFLRRLNVLDYSLLLAQQPLHSDERSQGLSFASLIMRTKMWVASSACRSQIATEKWGRTSTTWWFSQWKSHFEQFVF